MSGCSYRPPPGQLGGCGAPPKRVKKKTCTCSIRKCPVEDTCSGIDPWASMTVRGTGVSVLRENFPSVTRFQDIRELKIPGTKIFDLPLKCVFQPPIPPCFPPSPWHMYRHSVPTPRSELPCAWMDCCCCCEPPPPKKVVCKPIIYRRKRKPVVNECCVRCGQAKITPTCEMNASSSNNYCNPARQEELTTSGEQEGESMSGQSFKFGSTEKSSSNEVEEEQSFDEVGSLQFGSTDEFSTNETEEQESYDAKLGESFQLGLSEEAEEGSLENEESYYGKFAGGQFGSNEE